MTMRLSRRLAVVLAVSLALNLFLGGMITAHWLLRGPPPHERGGRFFDRHAALQAIGEEHRALVESIWARNEPELRERMHAVRAARREVRRQLMSDPLDREALALAHESLAARAQEAHARMRANIAEIATALPAEARRRYFEASFRRRRHGGDGPFGPPPEGPPGAPREPPS